MRPWRALWAALVLAPAPAEVRTGVHRSQSGHPDPAATESAARAEPQHPLQALWADLPAGVVVHALDGTIVDANPAAARLLGLSAEALCGVGWLDPRWRTVREDGSLCPGREHPAMRTLRSGQAVRNETLGWHTTDGELRWLLINTEPQRDLNGTVTGVIVCFIDFTDRRPSQDPLHASACTDSLTDALTRLPNREGVLDRLERAIAHGRRHPGYGFAVLLMDFDRFTRINLTLGHSIGDELLRQIAARLQQALRPGDALARVDSGLHTAARTGGDEFVVVLEGVRDEATVKAVAERLLADLAEPYNVGAHPVRSSVSIGVVRWQGQASGAEEILRHADTAIYEAKRAGRGRVVIFDDSMHERVLHALAMEAELRLALRRDELFVVYQPMVDLGTRAMSGVEALVRWQHPERGLLMPAEFIAIAEECGLIEELGPMVLRKACEQFVLWQAAMGPAAPAQLAVNLSRTQLKRAGLVAEVAQVLADTRMPPQRLQMEVTESLATQDERIQATLRELKRLGVRLALDDFGTGYSSLACLHQVPVDTVKIDRSFVRHARTVEVHRVLIEATIRVARALGMAIVAKGIETPDQAALMHGLGCDGGQGHLFGPPMSADELACWAGRGVAAAAQD